MEFKPRVPRADVNVSPTRPLREAAALMAGLTLIPAVAFGLVAWSVDAVVLWIPAETEARVFSGRNLGLAGLLPDVTECGSGGPPSECEQCPSFGCGRS